MAKILVHLHPRMSFLLKSIELGDQLGGTNEYIILAGPCMQMFAISRFYKYLIKNKRDLESITGKKIYLKRIRFIELLPYLYRAILYFFLPAKCAMPPQSLGFASIDSIVRKRWSYLYLFSIPVLRSFFEWTHLVWGLSLTSYYKDFINKNSIELSILSHSTYVSYVSLIEAAIALQKAAIAIGDSVDILITRRQEIYHARRVVKSLSERALIRLRRSKPESEVAPPISLLGYNSFSRPSTYHANTPPKRALLIMPHCFKDCNHLGKPSMMLYKTYFDWLVSTVITLTTRKSLFDTIIFKVHPHAERYQDLTLMKLLGWTIFLGKNRKKFIFIDEKNNPSDKVCNLLRGHSITAVTVHGSSALEYSTQGVGSISAGEPITDVGAVCVPKSVPDYKNMLLLPALSASKVVLDQDIVNSCRRIMESFALLKAPNALQNIIGEMDEYFYFGITSRPVDEGLHALLVGLRTRMDPFFIQTPDGNDLIGYKQKI